MIPFKEILVRICFSLLSQWAKGNLIIQLKIYTITLQKENLLINFKEYYTQIDQVIHSHGSYKTKVKYLEKKTEMSKLIQISSHSRIKHCNSRLMIKMKWGVEKLYNLMSSSWIIKQLLILVLTSRGRLTTFWGETIHLKSKRRAL